MRRKSTEQRKQQCVEKFLALCKKHGYSIHASPKQHYFNYSIPADVAKDNEHLLAPFMQNDHNNSPTVGEFLKIPDALVYTLHITLPPHPNGYDITFDGVALRAENEDDAWQIVSKVAPKATPPDEIIKEEEEEGVYYLWWD